MPFPEFSPTVPNLVRIAAEKFGSRTFLVANGERVTYREADARSAAVAKGLLAEGIGKGARVGILVPNSVDFAIAAFAVARIGAVFVPINTFYQSQELAWAVGHADLAHLIAWPRFLSNDYLERLEECFPDLADQRADRRLQLGGAPFLQAVSVWGDSDRPWSRGGEDAITSLGDRAGTGDEFLREAESCVVPADAAVVVYSSGSTGDPKGSIHTQGAIVRHSYNIVSGYPMARDDVVFSSMPFFWIGGLVTTLLEAPHFGATLVTMSSFDAGRALELIERERVTIATGWPQQGKSMSEHPSFASRDLSPLARSSMSDLVPPERRPPAVTSPSLGMTETCSSHTLWDQYDPLLAKHPGTFGKPLEGLSHRIVDPDTGESLPPGGEGEVWVRGYSLMQGLERREREEVFEPDGWYRTGDAGRFDDDGWLYFTGRLGDMIKTSGGANVTPAEIEATLMSYSDVLEAYVTGIPSDEEGQLVVGAVVPRAGEMPDGEELRARLKRDLSAYKVPRHLWICAKADLPFLDSGKIKKQALAERITRQYEDRVAEK